MEIEHVFSEGPFLFVDEDLPFENTINKDWINWLRQLFNEEKKKLNKVCFHYCSDDFLHKLNLEFLQHDTYTDIISFQYKKNPIEGDIYISLDRARENAISYETTELEEIIRLHAHGCLHFCGYKDKSEAERKIMKEKEDKYISSFNFVAAL